MPELLAQVASLLAAELTVARNEEDEPRIEDRPSEWIFRDAAEVARESVAMMAHGVSLSPSSAPSE